MRLVLALAAVAFIPFLSHPYIKAVYVGGIQKDIPRDRSELFKQYANNDSSSNDMHPLKNFFIRATIRNSEDILIPYVYKYGTYHNVLDVQVMKCRCCYGWYNNLLDVLIDETFYFNSQAAL